jgi:hypothetical protein
MSKKKIDAGVKFPRQSFAAAALALIIAWLSCASIASAQTGVSAPPASVNAKEAALAAATGDVLRETSEVRKLSILRDVPSGLRTREQIEAMILRNLDEQSKPEDVRADGLLLKKLGLVPPDFEYRKFLVKLLGEQVAGFYEPKSQKFYLAAWIAADLDSFKPVMAHELTHALQDQHFNLRRFEKRQKGASDAELAAHALIEGDASLTMMFYAQRNPLRLLALLKALKTFGAASTEEIDRAPRALRETLLFPYQQGLTWTQQLYARGGWQLVSNAYTDLPQSTEQILHVEKYLAREAPIKVEQPNVAAALGKDWRQIERDTSGEWNLYLILDEFLKSPEDAKRAAAGWGGDQFALYENSNTHELLFAQLTAWDTEQDAREFFDAYARRTARRYKLAEEAMSNDETENYRTNVSRAWQTNEGAVFIERRGARVLILEGVPPKIGARKLSAKFWSEEMKRG